MSMIQLDIYLSADELQKAYRGVDMVNAVSTDGRRVRFPVKILWPYITHDGIRGRFQIEFSDNGKFKAIERVF